jgi:hypothetical protein
VLDGAGLAVRRDVQQLVVVQLGELRVLGGNLLAQLGGHLRLRLRGRLLGLAGGRGGRRARFRKVLRLAGRHDLDLRVHLRGIRVRLGGVPILERAGGIEHPERGQAAGRARRLDHPP